MAWRSALRIRMVELEIARRYGQPGGGQPMRCPVHLSLGQEVVAAMICSHLGPDDMVVASHRCHAAYLAKGGSLEKMVAELYGRATGCCGGRGGSMHLMDPDAGVMWCDPTVGAALPIAAGLATRCNPGGRVVAFCGDGAVEEGIFAETWNLALLWNLPLLVVVEDNGLSVHAHQRSRQGDWLTERPRFIHTSLDRWDGTELPLCPGGVVFEDCWRAAEHCGPQHDLAYGAIPWWTADADPRDPLLPPWLWERGEADVLAVEEEIRIEIEAAFTAAESAPFPEPGS